MAFLDSHCSSSRSTPRSGDASGVPKELELILCNREVAFAPKATKTVKPTSDVDRAGVRVGDSLVCPGVGDIWEQVGGNAHKAFALASYCTTWCSLMEPKKLTSTKLCGDSPSRERMIRDEFHPA